MSGRSRAGRDLPTGAIVVGVVLAGVLTGTAFALVARAGWEMPSFWVGAVIGSGLASLNGWLTIRRTRRKTDEAPLGTSGFGAP